MSRIRFTALVAASVAVMSVAATRAAVAAPEEGLTAELIRLKTDLSATVLEQLEAREPLELLVLFDDADIRGHTALLPYSEDVERDATATLEYMSARWDLLKAQTLADLDADPVRDFSHLPMAVVKVADSSELERLLVHDAIAAVYENRLYFTKLNQSLPLINQPAAANRGYTGRNKGVAVLDTGVDYARAAFGSCSNAGDPGCSVVYANDIAPDDNARDDDGHGTNVAGIVLGVAPDADIISLDVFDGGSASIFTIVDAINWSLANAYNFEIVAINLSLGTPNTYPAQCGGIFSAFETPFSVARSIGILPVVAAGNEADTQGLSEPACTPGAVSVGSVLDAPAPAGGYNYRDCSDAAGTPADRVSCFSNSAQFLTMLAPGASIAAANITAHGTSQAAPHVAGAVAVLRQAWPYETDQQILDRLVTNGVPVTDPRNGLTHPRLDLDAALGSDPCANSPWASPCVFVLDPCLGDDPLCEVVADRIRNNCIWHPELCVPRDPIGPDAYREPLR